MQNNNITPDNGDFEEMLKYGIIDEGQYKVLKKSHLSQLDSDLLEGRIEQKNYLARKLLESQEKRKQLEKNPIQLEMNPVRKHPRHIDNLEINSLPEIQDSPRNVYEDISKWKEMDEQIRDWQKGIKRQEIPRLQLPHFKIVKEYKKTKIVKVLTRKRMLISDEFEKNEWFLPRGKIRARTRADVRLAELNKTLEMTAMREAVWKAGFNLNPPLSGNAYLERLKTFNSVCKTVPREELLRRQKTNAPRVWVEEPDLTCHEQLSLKRIPELPAANVINLPEQIENINQSNFQPNELTFSEEISQNSLFTFKPVPQTFVEDSVIESFFQNEEDY